MLDLLILSLGSFLLYLVGFPLMSLIIFGTLWVVIMALKTTGSWAQYFLGNRH